MNSILALTLGLLSTAVIASEYNSPVKNIDVYEKDLPSLSIHNISNEEVQVDILGQVFSLIPLSGVSFECLVDDNLELQFKGSDSLAFKNHPYFEVPCQSRVVINALFTNQYELEK